MKSLRATPRFELPTTEFWLVTLALAVAVLAGVLLPIYGGSLIAGPIVGLILVAAVFHWPVAGLVGAVTLTSTIFNYGGLPRVGVSGASLYLPEIVLLVLVAWTLHRTDFSSRNIQRSRWATLAFVGLMVSAGVSVLVSWLVRGESLTANLTQARWAALFGLYFVTRQVLDEDARAFKRLIFALFAIGVVTAIVFDLMVLTSLRDVMSAYSWFDVDSHDLYVSASANSIQGARIYMAGRALVQALFLPALVGMIVSPPGIFRRISVALTLVFGITIVLIFTRMVWLTTLITVALLGVLLTRKQRLDLVKVSAWVALTVVVASAILSLSTSWAGSSPIDTLSQRFGTIFSDNVQDQDAQYRFDEAQATLAKASGSWILGWGFLATVQTVPSVDSVTGEPIFSEIGTGHNGYLSLLLNTGLIGLGFFVLLSALIVRATWAARTQLPTQDRFTWAMTLGFGLTLVRILLNGVSESTFSDSFTVPLIAVAFALVERGLAGNLGRNSTLAAS